MKPSKKKASVTSLKSRKFLSVVILIAIIAVAAVILVITRPSAPAVPSDTNASIQTAGNLYTKSVDLANAGQYQQALDAADQALAMNTTSLTGLIQSNRAGILVMLNRDDEAITAADAALAIEGNLTTVHSIAWYNRGNALRALGRIDEARAAYANATALDPSLRAPQF